MKRFFQFLFTAIIAIVLDSILAAMIFIASIGIYAEFVMPDVVEGDTVAYNIARGFGLETSQLGNLVESKILTRPELELFKSDSMVRRDVIWHTILPAYGIYPYPASIYHDLPFSTIANTPAEQPYLDARVAAIVCGLATADDDPEEYMAQEEYDTLIAKLETGTIKLPDYESDCPYLADQTWTAETYRGRNALIISWDQIPASWRNDFIAQEWNIEFTLPATIQLETGEVSRSDASGLADYRQKVIKLDTSSPSTVLHEFAHYATFRAGWLYDIDIEEDFLTEAPKLQTILGDYSQTSQREYLAEFASFWILHPEFQSQLQQLAPHTSVHVEMLISDYTSLLPTEAP